MGLPEDIREVVEELIKSEGRIKSEAHVNALLAKLHASDKEEKEEKTSTSRSSKT